MIVTSLLLTFATTLGCSNSFVSAGNVKALQNEADEIIRKASAEFDFEGKSLELCEQFGIAKRSLLEYYEENELLEDDYLDAMRINVLADDSETKIEFLNYNSPFETNVSTKSFVKKLSSTSLAASNSVLNAKTGKFNVSDKIFCTIDTGYEMFTYDPIGGGGSNNSGGSSNSNTQVEPQQLPIRSYNETNIASASGGKLDGITFIGIMVSRDACVSFYNTVAGFLNKQVIYTASGIKGPASMIIDTLLAATPVAAAVVISAISGYLSSLWTGFCSLFTSGGPVGIIVGLIIALVGIACIATLATMLVMGYFGKGFAVGWKVSNIFNWKWYCGEAN